MPGLRTEDIMEECPSEEKSKEAPTVPARKITDFFKQPSKVKEVSTHKPTTLLGYFKKSESTQPGGLVGLISSEKEGSCVNKQAQNDNQTKKTKRKLEEDVTTDPKRKKKKSRVSSEGAPSIDQKVADAFIQSKTLLNNSADDFEPVLTTKKSHLTNENGGGPISADRKESSSTTANDSVLEISYEDYISQISFRNGVTEENPEEIGKSIPACENSSELSNEGEVSYEEFLQSLKSDDENSSMPFVSETETLKDVGVGGADELKNETAGIKKLKNKNAELEDSINNEVGEECCSQDTPVLKKPVSTFGIEQYFAKKKFEVLEDESEDEIEHVTVKAEIHSAPSPPTPPRIDGHSEGAKAGKSKKRRKNNVVVDSSDPEMEIVELDADKKVETNTNKAPKSKTKMLQKGGNQKVTTFEVNEERCDANESCTSKDKGSVNESNGVPEVKMVSQPLLTGHNEAKTRSCQSTLNFGQKPLSKSDSPKSQEKVRPKWDKSLDSFDESVVIINTPEKKAARNKPRRSAAPVHRTRTSTPLKPKNQSTSTSKRKTIQQQKKGATSSVRSKTVRVEDCPATSNNKDVKKKSKKLYKSTAVDKGSLKLTLSRINKTPVEKDAKKTKQTSAKKLLAKAKTKKSANPNTRASKKSAHRKVKASKMSNPNTKFTAQPANETLNLRRSSRRCAVTANKAIADSLTVVSPSSKRGPKKEVVPLEETSSPSKTPKRKHHKASSSPKSSPKKAGRIPSMFLKKGATVGSPVKPVVEKIQLSESARAFLFSGIPESMRKKAAATVSIQLGDYAPLPSISHVQQKHCKNLMIERHLEQVAVIEDKGIAREVSNGFGDVAMVTETAEQPLIQVQSENVNTDNTMHSNETEGMGEDTDAVSETLVASDGLSDNKMASSSHAVVQPCEEVVFSKLFEKNPEFVPMTEETLWNLPQVDLLLNKSDGSFVDCCKRWCADLLPKREGGESLRIGQDFKQHAPIKSDVSQALLSELLESNPAFPVHRIYKRLLEKKEASLKSVAKSQDRPQYSSSDAVVENHETENKCSKAKTVLTKKASSKDVSQTGRRSSKRCKRKSSDDVVVVEEHMEKTNETDRKEVAATSVANQLWTDVYCPSTSKDIIGNSGAIRKLRQWLQEWKQRMDREERALRKQLMKQAKDKRGTQSGWLTDDDSDFELSDDSGSNLHDYDSLCNTTVLVGPHGVGKSASVAALAKELGYKIFEVNSTCKRSSKQILSQLKEATQSQQVSGKGLNTGVIDSMFDIKPASAPKKPKIPTAFAGFFKKSLKEDSKSSDKSLSKSHKNTNKDTKIDDGQKTKSTLKSSPAKGVKSKTSRKPGQLSAKQDASSQDSSNGIAYKGLNLSSLSLILFEEVDVLFDDDKGFWSAVQTLINSTKKPIILTASNPNFTLPIDGQCELVHYKTPSVTNITSLLQTVCIAENARTDPKDIALVVESSRCDIRYSMLQLQSWLSTGGGVVKQAQTPSDKVIANHISQSNLITDSPVAPKNKRRRIQPIIDDGDNSLIDFDTGSQSNLEHDKSLIAVNKVSLEEIPVVNFGSFQSIMGIGSSPVDLLERLKECVHQDIGRGPPPFPTVGGDILYSNMADLLPLPKTVVHSSAVSQSVPGSHDDAKPKRSRILNDLYDSEGSSDGFLSLSQPQACAKAKSELGAVKEQGQMQDDDMGKKILCSSLGALADLYDTFSFCDSYLVSYLGSSQSTDTVNNLLPGNADHMTRQDDSYWPLAGQITEVSACIKCGQLKKCCENLQCALDKCSAANSNAKDRLVIPIETEGGTFQLTRHHDESLLASNLKMVESVQRLLPEIARRPSYGVSTDYVPALRQICKTEQNREVAKVKRRFMHYLTNSGLILKPALMEALCSSFN